MTTPIKLVVFDMAGTTVRDLHEVESCFSKAAQETGLIVSDAQILAMQGYSKKYVFEIFWKEKLGEGHPELEENVSVSYDYFCYTLEQHYLKNEVFPTDGCLEVFDFLRNQDIKIALTTGFYRKVTDIILYKLGWLNGLNEQYLNVSGNATIDVSIASDEVVKGRPEPHMIQKAMKLLGITDTLSVINIGDTPSDLKSGIRAGCRLSLGVTNGTHSREQLAIYRHHALLNDLPALIDLIKQIK